MEGGRKVGPLERGRKRRRGGRREESRSATYYVVHRDGTANEGKRGRKKIGPQDRVGKEEDKEGGRKESRFVWKGKREERTGYEDKKMP